MKHAVFCVLAASLVLGAGCSKKNEDGTTERMSAEEVAVKTQETTVQVTEKAAEMTETAKKATAAVSSFSVKAEDVLGDLNQSVEEIRQKVAGFDKSQVLAYAGTYKDVLLEKRDQLAGLSEWRH